MLVDQYDQIIWIQFHQHKTNCRGLAWVIMTGRLKLVEFEWHEIDNMWLFRIFIEILLPTLSWIEMFKIAAFRPSWPHTLAHKGG